MFDPFTLMAAASAAVNGIKKACDLYKEVKGVAGNVKEVLDDINSQFAGKTVSKEQAQQIEQERERVKEAAKTDPGDVISQIGQQLGEFFDAMDKIEHAFHEQERKAQEVFDDTDGSLKRMALNRVLIRTRLEQMHAEIREQMTWNTPQELGDLWSRFNSMWEQTLEEQTAARQRQLVKDRIARWRRERIRNAVKDNLLWAAVAFVLALEAMGLLWTIRLHRQNEMPSLLDYLS